MSKIIGNPVGTTLPKSDWKQTDPTKGDYIKNKPDFEGLKNRVDVIDELVGDTSVSEQIGDAVASCANVNLTNIDDEVFKAKVESSGFSSGTQVQFVIWEAND